MARPINRLSARAVASATTPGYVADGGGLYLQISSSGTKAWVFRYERAGRRREMGLGSAAIVSLQEARSIALQQRLMLVSGKDPLEERRLSRAVAKPRTWGDCVDAYIDSHRAGWKNDAQADQWEQSLREYGPKRAAPVASIDTGTVMDCLLPIWTTKTETATRVRGRIERVLDWARVSGFRAGENPARWRGHLDKLLPRPSKVKKPRHFPAMPYQQLPAFMAMLMQRDTLAAQALAFTIITAVRTSETTGAGWTEFAGDLWTIPGERMKAGTEHVVPLVPAATKILAARPKGSPPFHLSENGMLYYLQRTLDLPSYRETGFGDAWKSLPRQRWRTSPSGFERTPAA